MKHTSRALLITLLLFFVATQAWADNYQKTKEMFSSAGIADTFNSAYGYAMFPNVAKAAFVVGGAYGEGRVYEQGKYIGDAVLTQASLGFQAGGAGFSQIIFFQDKRALDEFTNGNFEFGAEVSGVALTAAAGASANTAGSSATASGGKNNANAGGAGYNKGMATYTVTKGGAMFEASLGGQNFKFKKLP